MDPNAKKKLIGAIIAAACAIAVYYGLIDQKQADSIRTQADQTLGNGPVQQQGAQPQAPSNAQNPQQQAAPQPAPPAPAATAPAPPTTTPAPRQQ